MSVKPNTKISSATAGKAIGTHAYIQEVTRCLGISTSTKVVLTYLLEKYQTTREDGRPWDFSNASIQDGTGIPERTVRYVMQLLIKSKVLRHYGQVKIRTRPMNLYLFAPEMLEIYLKKDTAMNEIVILDNDTNGETPIEALPESRDTAKDTARDTAKTTDQKKSTQEDYQKKKEESTSTSTPADALMEMERQLNDGFACKSGSPSIVPGSAFNSKKTGSVMSTSTPSRFNVPNGIDDKVRSHDHAKVLREQEWIQNAFMETVLEWNRQRVPKDIIQKRIDAFKVQADNVHSALDVIRVFKAITDKEGK